MHDAASHDPPPEELDPLAAAHAPPLQTWPDAHAAQLSPPVPHAVGSVPARQWLVMSQHPEQLPAQVAASSSVPVDTTPLDDPEPLDDELVSPPLDDPETVAPASLNSAPEMWPPQPRTTRQSTTGSSLRCFIAFLPNNHAAAP